MLNDNQLSWFGQISDKDLSGLFQEIRRERLQTLDNSATNYEHGRAVQDEISALFRLEKRFLNFKQEYNKKDNEK